MSDEEPKKDYEVGYGKPPRCTQFQPGQSGNYSVEISNDSGTIVSREINVNIGYELALNLLGVGTVEVIPDLPVYPPGTEVQLTATPGEDRTFLGWNEIIQSPSTELSITMDENIDMDVWFSVVPGDIRWSFSLDRGGSR